MMQDVVEDESAHHGRARAFKYHAVATAQAPLLERAPVIHALQALDSVRDVLVELLKNLRDARRVEGLVLSRREVERVRAKHGAEQARQLRDVAREAAECHGLLVRLPVKLVFGDTF